MKSAQLYCQPACAVCQSLADQLHDSGIDVVVSDVTDDPGAFDAVVGLGYRSLPVLIASDGTSAAGEAATELGAQLSRSVPMFVDANVPSGTLNNKRKLS